MVHLKERRKIRVMFIIDFLDGITGGTENQLVKLINNLDNNKYDLHLLSLKNTRWIIENKSKLTCSTKTHNIIKLKNPINIISFILVIKYMKEIHPDIVMTFFPLSNILGVIAARFAKVKVIISTRRDYGLWLNKWAVYFLRFSNRFVKGIVTNSRKVKELTSVAEHFDSSKIRVIYNGIDIHNFRPCKNEGQLSKKELGISPQNKVVGIVANLRPMKRYRTFIKATKRVLKVRPDVDFVIVGDGPLKSEIEALTADLGIEKHVHFVGEQEDILPFLSIFDIGVNCSANEGLSNAIMEYMAYGIPCIAARAGGNEELIVNGVNGYTFELDNDKELAELIVSLLEDKQKRKEFTLKSKEIVLKRMKLERIISDYDHYFTQMLANG